MNQICYVDLSSQHSHSPSYVLGVPGHLPHLVRMILFHLLQVLTDVAFTLLLVPTHTLQDSRARLVFTKKGQIRRLPWERADTRGRVVRETVEEQDRFCTIYKVILLGRERKKVHDSSPNEHPEMNCVLSVLQGYLPSCSILAFLRSSYLVSHKTLWTNSNPLSLKSKQ